MRTKSERATATIPHDPYRKLGLDTQHELAEKRRREEIDRAAEYHGRTKRSISERVTDAMGLTAQTPAPAADVTDQVRAIIVDAVTAGRKLTASEVETVNGLLRGKKVAAFAAAAKRFADAVAAGQDVAQTLPELSTLLSDGAAASLMIVATERKALADVFSETPWARRGRQLEAARETASEAHHAAQADENTTEMKRRRLHEEYLSAMRVFNEHGNLNDADVVSYRRALRPTADPALPALNWKSFLI